MNSFLGSSLRKAFTLIELIIVILIISLAGFMVFSEVRKNEEKADVIDPTSLPIALKKSFSSNQELEFFCIKSSTECYVAQGRKIVPYKGLIQFGKDLEVYKVDENNHLVKIDEFGRIKDEKITFRFTLYANGSNTQVVLANDEGVYFIPSYFGKPQKVASLDEAKALWLKEKFDLTDLGNYY